MKLILFLMMVMSNIVHCQESFGVKYDALKLAKLKHPLEGTGKDLLPLGGDLENAIEYSVVIDSRLFRRVDKLFDKSGNFDNGRADVSYQAFALVFFNDGKVVLTVAPNVLGGDVYSTDNPDKSDPRSFSKDQLAEFLKICFEALSLDQNRSRREIKRGAK